MNLGAVARASNQVDPQVAALTRSFLARFFENEITNGTNDLKNSFFWLISFIAAPALFMPVFMGWSWAFIAHFRGLEALRTIARVDKTFYVGLGMIATSVIGAIIWNSLLIDRRDALVLGVLPVRPAAVVRAKLAALAVYVSIVSASIHALASVSFGICLGSENTLVFVFRGIVAHFGASVLASAFALLAITSVQGCLLALLGPRLFQRMSPILQLGLIAVILLALFSLPQISLAVNDTLAGSGKHVAPWILYTPPLWFLGIYEWILGTTDPALVRLALTGIGAIAGTMTVTAVTYAVAYRRVMVEAVEHPEGLARTGATARIAHAVTTMTGRRATVRATSQFFLTTVGRVERHRFVVAIALGVIAAWDLPAIARLMTAGAVSATPGLTPLALPLAAIAFMLVGLRIAVSLPSDLNAAWIFALSTLPAAHVRAALRRTMMGLGVAPFVLMSMPLYWRWWGATVAVTHAGVCLALGSCLIEILLRGTGTMPCSSPWRPERANLKKWWPAYLFGFLAFTGGASAIEMRFYATPVANVALIAAIAAIALVIRLSASRTAPAPPEDCDPLGAPHVLGLS